MHGLIATWFSWVHDWGYLGIIILMAMESSITPVPSEIVIAPAAFYIAEGKMSFAGVVLAGTLGSYIGAAITYWVSRWLGRAVVVRYGRYFFITEKKLEQAEIWMHRYEAGGIFFARLLPVIRHLISIPAGLMEVSFGMFSAMTIIGSLIWCSVLAYLGNLAHQQEPDLIKDPEAMMHFVKHHSLPIVGCVLVFAILYFIVVKLTSKPKTALG